MRAVKHREDDLASCVEIAGASGNPKTSDQCWNESEPEFNASIAAYSPSNYYRSPGVWLVAVVPPVALYGLAAGVLWVVRWIVRGFKV
jgi:hypothetical protein